MIHNHSLALLLPVSHKHRKTDFSKYFNKSKRMIVTSKAKGREMAWHMWTLKMAGLPLLAASPQIWWHDWQTWASTEWHLQSKVVSETYKIHAAHTSFGCMTGIADYVRSTQQKLKNGTCMNKSKQSRNVFFFFFSLHKNI